MQVLVEVCCGSYYDALQAYAGGAGRIELNSALSLGGLTPAVSVLRLTKERMPDMKVIPMLRPRAAGFCYTAEEFAEMEASCRELLKGGADGIAFGCLKEDSTLDTEKIRRILALIKEAGKEAVIHRAFDCIDPPFSAIETLIGLGADRILTSGQKPSAPEGADRLKELQARYGDRIEILAGSGVNEDNAAELIARTGVRQIHSSCKGWKSDPTTVSGEVSYSVFAGEKALMYDVVSADRVRALIEAVSGI